MSELPAAPEVARQLADALEQAGISYAIGGALAYGFHAPPRATNDVDLNAFVPLDQLDGLLDALEAGGAELNRAAARSSAATRGDFRAHVRGMRIDIFVPSIPLCDAAEQRVLQGLLLGRPIKILTAEDLVLFKLLFYRPKDLLDVERLVAFQGEALDRDYIRRWLVEMMGEEDVRLRRWDQIVTEYGTSRG